MVSVSVFQTEDASSILVSCSILYLVSFEMKTIYISLPMSGQEDTIWERYTKAELELKQKFGNSIEIKGPYNVQDFKEPDIFEYDRDWCYYMSKDVEDLLRSDAIYLTKGWLKSKGCRVEKAISVEMGKEIIYAEDSEK